MNSVVLQTSSLAILVILIKPADLYQLTIGVARLLLAHSRQRHSHPDRWLMSQRAAAIN